MNVTEEVLRFAELAARTGLEPELAQRYESDPAAVLAEFGISGNMPRTTQGTTVIEDLSAPEGHARDTIRWCFGGIPFQPDPAGAPAAASAATAGA
ncbi:hypothetical protein [Streptomyces sp. NPDC050738]|uniref:hypothetical protein n=1 Tax=Streptomyces sp. NPDC050738 TaxID=3154744 RepID=UPI00341CFB5E